jgi:hypothetical protein
MSSPNWHYLGRVETAVYARRAVGGRAASLEPAMVVAHVAVGLGATDPARDSRDNGSHLGTCVAG